MDNEKGEPIQPNGENLTLTQIRQLIDNIGTQVVNDLLKIEPAIQSSQEMRHNYCRKINGEILTRLINQYKIPGMIYTLEPMEKFFNNGSWSFHSVGVLKTSESQYIAYDQTNTDSEGKFFFVSGSLKHLSSELQQQFGLDWRLEYVPKTNPNNVRKKITNAELMIQNRDPARYSQDIFPMSAIRGTTQTRLGMLFIPLSKGVQSELIREKFTFGFA